MLLWQSLRSLDPSRPVFVEAESKRVGAVTIHPSVFEAMQRADVVNLEAPLAARVDLLCEDYRHFINDLPSFTTRLAALRPIVGARVHDQWIASCEQGQWATMVEDLLVRHYDPNYIKAGDRLYPKSTRGHHVHLADLSETTLRQCAEHLIQSTSKA
jgi:tRNA 2-selenouridine synthase